MKHRSAKQITGKEIKLGLNAVGGESALELAKALAPHGTLVTYGAMGREPLRLDNALLIFRDIRCRGFWVSDWDRYASRAAIAAMSTALEALVRAGKFRVPFEQIYPLAQVREALAHAARAQRTGKICSTSAAAGDGQVVHIPHGRTEGLMFTLRAEQWVA